jgi:hypothetical protein
MFKPKPKTPLPPTRVWRISPSAPKGEWVDLVPQANPRATPQADKDLPEVSYGTWVTSSYDLLDGADVSDDPDTLPGELFDELFMPKKGTR